MIEELKQVAGLRSLLYKNLAGYYLGVPAREQIEVFLDSDFLENLSGIFAPEILEPFQKFISGGEWNYESLKQEYTNIFIVPSGRYVTPYENVYRGKRIENGMEVLGLLQGPHTISVKGQYQRAGAELDMEYKDLPDFVGLEFSFMHFLCDRENTAWDTDQDTEAMELLSLQKAFIQGHLNHWIPELCAKVRSNTSNDFIIGISLLTEAFLKIENETLESIEIPSNPSNMSSNTPS